MNLLTHLKRQFPSYDSPELNRKHDEVQAWLEREHASWAPLKIDGSDQWFGLFVRGDPSALQVKSIAVVGTRKVSPYGKTAAKFFAEGLVAADACIVSGLAYGVDAEAHEAALRAKGKTVAVLAHGLDEVYPRGHQALARKILENGGCLVSEYAPGTPPFKNYFPARNRIIAALSLGTLVVEAPEKSGSLITARHAIEYHREVFVVPGPYQSERYLGSHRLIQQGAKCVIRVEDIVEEYQNYF